MTSRPSCATLLLCCLLLSACEVPPPEQAEVAASDTPADTAADLSVERSMPPIRRMVREIAETGAFPVIIGGDHSIEFANVAGLADVYGKESVGVIHFDAYYDAGDAGSGRTDAPGSVLHRPQALLRE